MPEFDETGEPLIDIARGDTSTSHRIRANLRTLQENSRNPDFQRLLQEVLDGRRSLREASRLPMFGEELNPHIDKFNDKWEEVMGEDQEIVSEDKVDEFRSLQAQVRQRMDEINDMLQAMQRYRRDPESGH